MLPPLPCCKQRYSSNTSPGASATEIEIVELFATGVTELLFL